MPGALVGMFPDPNRRVIQAEVNPLDKSTIFSIYPRRIVEIKPTIQPGKFTIEAGSEHSPASLIVGSSSWWRDIDDDSPLLEIPISSVQIADSIVRDWANGLLACNMSDEMPGIFFIPGHVTIEELRSVKYKARLTQAVENQKRWYLKLVMLADSLWSRSNGNPLAISDDMRLAAKELGLDSKDWLQDFQSQVQIRCVACGSMRNPLYPICGSCHTVIDVEAAKKLGLQFVQR